MGGDEGYGVFRLTFFSKVRIICPMRSLPSLSALLIGLLWVGTGTALYEDLPSGPIADALGGATVAYPVGLASIYGNPAGLVSLTGFQAETFYKPLYGGLGIGLRTLQASVAMPYRGVGIALSYKETGATLTQDGYENAYSGAYREGVWTLSLARSLTEAFAFGLNFHLYHFQEPRFGGVSTFGLDFGLLARFYRRWALGASVTNFNRPRFHGTYRDEPLPVAVAVGLRYQPWAFATTVVQARKTPDHPARVAFGQEIRWLAGKVALRVGVAQEGEVTTPSLGFGVVAGPLRLDYATVLSLDLPVTHVFGLTYRR